jgi:hypothetical protein
MNIILLAPKVAQNYIGQFPETTNNAYKYFNYDNRVVNERAETRFDHQAQFKGPEELTNQDYDTILSYAKTLFNPILEKYSHSVACEDALMMAIRSYDRGIYDGKINASKYNLLLATMKNPQPVNSYGQSVQPSMHHSAEDIEARKKTIPKNILKRLDITDVPLKTKLKPQQRGQGLFVKQPGVGIVLDKPEKKVEKKTDKKSTENTFFKEEAMALKNAQQYTERLDAIAAELETISPELAYNIDVVSDVIEGKREASTLKFDADEGRYMANRFNMNVRSRESDEPYMDDFNKSNFEQVMKARKNPTPIKLAYQKI